jgi:hypothetical protein
MRECHKESAFEKDMQFLMNLKPLPNTRKRHSLNYFVFSYLTRGMNLKDGLVKMGC